MDEQSSTRPGNRGWHVLAAFGLVLLGTISYALGRFADQATFDYISISCSAAAAVMLVTAVRTSKRVGNAGA